jgi:hypothetical protein
MQLVPRDAAATEAFDTVTQVFGSGTTYPFRFAMVPPEGEAVISPQHRYTISPQSCNVTSQILKRYFGSSSIISGFNITAQVLSLSYVSGLIDLCGPLNEFSTLDAAETCAAFGWNEDIQFDGASCADLKGLYERYNKSGTALYAEIMLNVDPNSQVGGKWIDTKLEELQSIVDDVPDAAGYTVALSSFAATQHASTVHCFSVFPMAVGITAGVVFVFVGAAFRSIVVSLRSVVSISLTLSIVYGAAIFIYEDGALQFLNFEGLKPLHGDASISWIPPILCFSLLVGLGLDYDIFLVGRIFEEKKENGKSDVEAIISGLALTGSTITAAGMIMATAFSGLLFSSEPVLNQVAFFLVLAVLVDTFVIRSLFVPSIMVMLQGCNFR